MLDTAGNETVLYNFTGGADGANPEAGLILDDRGNLYGTTGNGGDLSGCGGIGCGVVFKLDPAGKETTLYSFTGGADGSNPSAGLAGDERGNLYGTTYYGGDESQFAGGYGVVFKLDPARKETVLHTLTGGADGGFPYGRLLLSEGNLYGVASGGGDLTKCGGYGCGVVFRLDRAGSLTLIHTFTGGADGSGPEGGLVRDWAGNLYGATGGGGDAYNSAGLVFKLTP